jgi:uncharacterized protein YyaL (SSP411 family)
MNRLARETSPYLRDHADQPVDWHPWSEAALGRARAENKPIFLSIGYSACHWCHVMARESFADPKLAEQLNRDFVCIKVDREERPDLDEIYIEAVRLMTGTAGWPLSVFLTPELKPFYGGTYFPPEQRGSLAGFSRVLTAVLHYFRTERHEVDEAANRVTVELNRLSTAAAAPGRLDDAPLYAYYRQRLEAFDSEHGGFGVAPKFPCPIDLSLLLRLGRRPRFSQARAIVELTLRRMADGGIHDQLAGGFHRYSTDTIWLVPHFEKMLYDNALLARTCAEAWHALGDDWLRNVALDTLAYMTRELGTADQAFCASQDADSSGREGGHYLWTLDQLRKTLGELAPLAADYYGVTETGHVEGANVLHLAVPVEVLMQRHRLSLDQLWQRLAEVRQKLLAARAKRPAVRTDSKVLADWNGLALSALAVCGRLFDDERLLGRARALAALLTGPMMPDRDLVHDRASAVPGQLSDYAFVAQGLLDLYDARFDIAHLDAALSLTGQMCALFAAPDGGFYTTRAGAAGLIARVRNGFDGAVPSGNSAAISNLLRLARLTGRDELERTAADALRSFSSAYAAQPTGFGSMLAALDLLLKPGPEVVLFLPEPTPEAAAMLSLLRRNPDDARTTAVVRAAEPSPELARLIPLTNGRKALQNLPTACVCHGSTCREPVHTAAELAQLLALEEDSLPG